MRAGDVIVSIDGRPIAGVGDLQRALVGDLVGRPVGVTIERDGALIELDVRPVELAAVTAACTIRPNVASLRRQRSGGPGGTATWQEVWT